MQAALAAMMAHGYRPDTNRPGHHMIVVRALSLTVGLSAARVTVLDTLRRKRNVSDYTGQDVDDESADDCAAEAERLLEDVRMWLRANRPNLAAK